MKVVDNLIIIYRSDVNGTDIKRDVNDIILDIVSLGFMSITIYLSTKVHGSAKISLNDLCNYWRNLNISVHLGEFDEDIS